MTPDRLGEIEKQTRDVATFAGELGGNARSLELLRENELPGRQREEKHKEGHGSP
jgi:hypothetical protein